MPESRKRKNHPYQKPADIPASQRVKGQVAFSILIAVFGIIIAYFLTSGTALSLFIGGMIGAILGFFIGNALKRDATKR